MTDTTRGEAVFIPPIGASPAGSNAGYSTCPICGRHWLVTPWDDYLMPSCGCYTDETKAPCESCGMAHAISHREITALTASSQNLAGSERTERK